MKLRSAYQALCCPFPAIKPQGKYRHIKAYPMFTNTLTQVSGMEYWILHDIRTLIVQD